jgi:hypothetical protein
MMMMKAQTGNKMMTKKNVKGKHKNWAMRLNINRIKKKMRK